jgi:hypothetical protein
MLRLKKQLEIREFSETFAAKQIQKPTLCREVTISGTSPGDILGKVHPTQRFRIT